MSGCNGQRQREEWRPVAGTSGRYDVSNIGRVRSWAVGGSPTKRAQKPRLMRLSTTARGYKFTRLVGYPVRMAKVHRLVLEAFRGPPPEGAEGSHLNGDPGDNRLSNLAWHTSRENAAMKIIHGTQHRGSSSHNAKLTEELVARLRRQQKTGDWPGCAVVAQEHGVSRCTIYFAVSGRTWKHVGEPPSPIRRSRNPRRG